MGICDGDKDRLRDILDLDEEAAARILSDVVDGGMSLDRFQKATSTNIALLRAHLTKLEVDGILRLERDRVIYIGGKNS
jgi:hypothetical protein